MWLIRLVIGYKIFAPIFQPMRRKKKKEQNQFHIITGDFSCAMGKLQVITRNSDWSTVLFFPVVIGWSNYFIIGFLTVSWKSLHLLIMPCACTTFQRADIALAGLTVSEVREKAVDFSVPFMHYTDDILLKRRSSDEDNTFDTQFLQPFHSDVWLALLVTLVVISVSTFILNYFSPYGCKDKNGQGTSEDFSFINSVWFTCSCMLQQGAGSQPRSLSGTTVTV